MGNIKLLDCTLRDGAYINGARFGFDSIKAIVDNLIKANVDIVECGWLKNDESNNDSTYFHVLKDINKFKFNKNNTKLSLMIDYNRYDVKNFDDEKSDIDYIRITFPIDDSDNGIYVGKLLRDKGIKVGFQLTNALAYLDKEIFKNRDIFFKKLNDLNPTCVCLADTFGSMVPKDVEGVSKLFDLYLDKKINLGLHTHNNMQLAFANTIKFIDVAKDFERDIIVDSSLLGMGRGTGNTPTELLTNYLNKYFGKNYNVDILLDLIDKYMLDYINKYSWSYTPHLAVAGMECSHINNISYLKEKHNVGVLELKKVLDNYEKNLKSKYHYDKLEDTYQRIKK